MSVEVVHWNPRRPVLTGRVGRRLPVRRPVNNFGDLIGPLLVERILHLHGLSSASGAGRLLSVGSILHFARAGDVVWGSGINGKAMDVGHAAELDVRAVRGALTRERLLALGCDVPAVFGDPALLWPRFWSREHYRRLSPGRRDSSVTIVPNLHDWPRHRSDRRAVDPRSPVHEVIRRIATSDFVVGSSLHAMVLADSFGIPARLMAADAEPTFKYDDYFSGTGRSAYAGAVSVDAAVAAGAHPSADHDADALLHAFPVDLWRRAA